MCKILAIINKKPSNAPLINKIIQANIEQLSKEDDGYTLYKNGRTYAHFGLNAYKFMSTNLTYHKEEQFFIHARTATGGSHGVDGLHMQRLEKRYIYAHNGWIGGFSNVVKKSDSHYFFARLLKKYGEPSFDTIVEAIGLYNFSGRALLLDEEKNELWFFANLIAHIYCLPDCLIMSSFELEEKLATYTEKSALGFTWREDEQEEKITGILHHEEVENVIFRFKDNELSEVAEIPSKVGQYRGFNNYSYLPDEEKQEMEKLFQEDL